MNKQQNTFKNTSYYFKNSVTIKILTIGFLILLLLIPLLMIQGLIQERKNRRNSVIEEISQKWGNRQTITGPFIAIPYKMFYKDEKGNTLFNLKYLYILPESLNIKGEIKPQIRYRSLFEAVLYNVKLHITGDFKLPPVSQLNIDPKNILWNKSLLLLGITDMRGIQDKIKIDFNNTPYDMSPGITAGEIAESGVSTLVKPLAPEGSNRFSVDLNLNGSEQIDFIPVGASTNLDLVSSWPSPSFNGAFLPAEREIKKDGFSAKWKVLSLNRNYPQFWEDDIKHDVKSSAFGVQMILTADIYQKTTRLAKYAIMFLLFTFASFFFSEIINKRKIHPIQYILIGMAILLFYTLVLSLSEYIHFNIAYVLSAMTITLVISGYAKAIVDNKKFSMTIMGFLTILYSYLFIILQLEDYSLIMGTLGLLIILGLVMYYTRKINWYEIEIIPDLPKEKQQNKNKLK